MTNEIANAVTNIVSNLGGDAQLVANTWTYYATIVGSIIGSLTVIAALDPTNKIAGVLAKVTSIFNILDPNKKQKEK